AVVLFGVAPQQVEDLGAAAPGQDAGQRITDRLAYQGDHEGQLAHAGQGGDAGDQYQQPVAAGIGRPVEQRPVQVAGQALGQQQGAGQHHVLQQRQGEDGQAGHQHEGQKGVTGGHRRREGIQLLAGDQGVGHHVEHRGNEEQDGDGAVGIQQIAVGAVEDQQTGEGDGGQQTGDRQAGPQRVIEDDQVDHAPQGREQGEEEGEQTHTVDDHGGPALAEQQGVSAGQQQLRELNCLQFVGQQRSEALSEQLEGLGHLLFYLHV